MFYHAVHLLNHGSALESGTLGLHGAQFCSLAGATDAGVVCTCASRTLSCPEPAIVGTTKGLHVNLPELGNKKSVQAFLAKHPNNAYLHNKPTIKDRDPIECSRINSIVAAGLPGCP